MWLKGMREDNAKVVANAHDEFKEKTKEITRRWKEGFAALKAENDERQERNKKFVMEQLKEINQWLADAIEVCKV
jgi:F0F1-type ATP synthase membrane subunit b/b'